MNPMNSRTYKMHMMATACNFLIAIAVIIAASLLDAPSVLNSVVVNVLAQPFITGSSMWSKTRDKQAKAAQEKEGK